MRTRITALLLLLTFVATGYYFSLPSSLFSSPYSPVLLSREGHLLAAAVATDGQWRFPQPDSLSPRFVQALVAYEDKRFFSHVGIDVRALARAIRQNVKAGSVVSGGSTLTMQVIRLSRKNKSRTITEKMIECVLATRLEWRYSKNEIVQLYATHAPFGGNVVGVEAACWRYFGRGPQELSWGEAALLAVLPNAPSLMHPGRNRSELLKKRNLLLDKLQRMGTIDATTCELAKLEPIPAKPQALPQLARHLLQRANPQSARMQTTIQLSLQTQVESIVQKYSEQLRANQVHNAAALVLNTKTGEVLAYVGNVAPQPGSHHGNEVDVVTSPRSTGSILKPFLFAAMLDEGKILPASLLPDVPTFINGFSPKNFTKQYDGAVHANEALIRSLNVPAVHMLKEYRYEKFYTLLKELGMNTLVKPADHYGLALILGGAEGTLWDVTGMYASMGRVLLHYFERPGAHRYTSSDVHAPMWLTASTQPTTTPVESHAIVSAAAIHQTFNALTEVYRPGEETGWRYFSNSKKIAWKTGTSYGYRDGWAVGVTPEFTVGVWVGNADGEGRPGLTGTEAASPLLFSIFAQLPPTGWFAQPKGEMKNVVVCKLSGYLASAYCPRDTVLVSASGLQAPVCSFHQVVHLSADARHRVSSLCYPVSAMRNESWFVLPPVQEYYFKEKNLSYKPLPNLLAGCVETKPSMEMIYPKQGARLFIPRELNGKPGAVVFQVAHSMPTATLYWHLDGEYVGNTTATHQLALQPTNGKHVLTLIDGSGNSLVRSFEVLSKL